MSALTEEQAMLAKSCPSIPGLLAFMAKCFKVSTAALSIIRTGKGWVHLPEPSKEQIQKAKEYLISMAWGQVEPETQSQGQALLTLKYCPPGD
jgi:hypothetical protein